jgi:mono/diheme cytochrome c family protein
MRLVLFFALGSTAVFGQDVQDAVRKGEQIFAKTCSTGYCHGPRGTAGGAPRLVARGFDQGFIATTVARGVPSTGMRGFAGELSNADLAAVVAYVATLNGIASPTIPAGTAGRGAASPSLSADAVRGSALFSDAVRGFGRCSTCHEVNGIGISVATPISQIPGNVQALRSLATPQVSTATVGGESMPVLPVSQTTRSVIFYDLTSSPPVLRTADPASVALADASTWRHSNAISSYLDNDLEAILAYLRAVVR